MDFEHWILAIWQVPSFVWFFLACFVIVLVFLRRMVR